MLRQTISHARLMRESADRVQSAASGSDRSAKMIARRILESPALRSQWESEHSNLMRQLANCGVRRAQVAALKHANFRLLHGKALFQYLRKRESSRGDRVRVMAHFRPGRAFENAVVSEHSVYVRKSCSFLCTTHVGSEVVRDPDFLDPMQRYEELYDEYFTLYCEMQLRPAEDSREMQGALLPLLKAQLNEYRWAILDPRRAQPFLRRDAELRRATGDTQRLPAPGLHVKGRR